jgi:hypothetical protein
VAFNADLPADAGVDPGYLASVNASFDWTEAQRRVAETLAAFEDST